MSEQAYQELLNASCQRLIPAFLVEEGTKRLLVTNAYINDRLGFDPAGRTCHHVFMGSEVPCAFCPERQAEGAQYCWEYFSSAHGRLYSVRHLFTQAGGVPCRVCVAEDASDIMSLSRSVVDYLSLMKFLSEMQARIIGDQDRTLEIVADFLRRQFRAERVAVTYPAGEGRELLLARGGTCPVRRRITGAEPELAALLAVPPSVLQVGGRVYELRLDSPANPAAWEENRQAVLCIVQLYLENALFREQIEWENHHDKSTTLYNRAHFMQLSRTCYGTLSQVGVIFLDIDNLKRVNDEYGHDMGDRLIRKAADVLLATAADDLHPYRMGGDEFLLVCCGADRARVEALTERLTAEMNTSNERVPMPRLSISLGWAHAAAPFRLEALVTAADEMMYAAKRARKAGR